MMQIHGPQCESCGSSARLWSALWTPAARVDAGTNLGKDVIVQRAWFSRRRDVASLRRFLMLYSTVLNSDRVPPYGCPGVPSIM